MSYLKYFESKSKDVVIVSMGPDDRFLESITEVAEKAGIHTGIVMTGIGGLKKVCYTEGATLKVLEGVFQIVNFNGIISSYKPHLHITMLDDHGTFLGGHLNDGCIVNSVVELSILKLPDLKLVSDYRDGSPLKLLDYVKE
jgi:predicted DNA-binding protein with PD1-like motif